jgi:hypothetical protein
MARTWGSLGVVKSEFERDFYAECRRLKIKPGRMAAQMLKSAYDANERREFAVLLKLALDQSSDNHNPQQQALPLLVVERYDNPLARVIEGEAVAA